MNKGVKLKDVVKFLDEYLNTENIKDFSGAYNGLQFQNGSNIRKIAVAVDAGLCEFKEAAKLGANLLIVHHGMLWENLGKFTGVSYEKVKTLIDNDIAVYSSHLPLDAHSQVGNNVLLAKALDLDISGRCFEFEGLEIGVYSKQKNLDRQELANRLKILFPDTFKAIEYGADKLKKVAICSGSSGDLLNLLAENEIDTLITGELKQNLFVKAADMGLNLYPCGHYATERFGVMALGELLSQKYGLEYEFIDMKNPL